MVQPEHRWDGLLVKTDTVRQDLQLKQHIKSQILVSEERCSYFLLWLALSAANAVP